MTTALIANAFLLGCSVEDGVLGRLSRTQAGTQAGTSGIDLAADGQVAGAGNPTAIGSCMLQSPTVEVSSPGGDTTYSTCTGRIAAARFNGALCSCGAVRVGDYLRTRGFDSTRGVYDPSTTDDGGAAVGINGDYASLAGYTDIGGSLSIAGTNGVRFVGSLLTRGDFRAAGNVTVTGTASIARDAWLSGSYFGLGPLTISGELHHAQSVVAIPLSTAHDYSESVSVPNPCPCESRTILDVTTLVDQAKQNNDNLATGVTIDALASVSTGTDLTLSCGRFYLSQISGTAGVTIRVQGLTALFVEGSIALRGSLNVVVAPGAELDLFIKGNLATSQSMSLGSEERPSAVRLFVAGTDDINLVSPFVGNLYAPNARVVASAAIEVFGAIFAREFTGAAYASFVHDRAIYDSGRSCPIEHVPVGACLQCGTCSGGTACVNGACGPCRVDADCCGQSVCANGACEPLTSILQ